MTLNERIEDWLDATGSSSDKDALMSIPGIGREIKKTDRVTVAKKLEYALKYREAHAIQHDAFSVLPCLLPHLDQLSERITETLMRMNDADFSKAMLGIRTDQIIDLRIGNPEINDDEEYNLITITKAYCIIQNYAQWDNPTTEYTDKHWRIQKAKGDNHAAVLRAEGWESLGDNYFMDTRNLTDTDTKFHYTLNINGFAARKLMLSDAGVVLYTHALIEEAIHAFITTEDVKQWVDTLPAVTKGVTIASVYKPSTIELEPEEWEVGETYPEEFDDEEF